LAAGGWRLAAGGAKVVITGCGQPRFDEAAGQIGKGASVIQADVSRLADHKALFEQVGREHSRIDILVANAGWVRSRHSGPSPRRRMTACSTPASRVAVAFLTNDGASDINGIELFADGGASQV
jgi:NAD(P)-dependent dehydrogenase (short-subunit alcohol dehydrogenase family)